MKDFLKKAIILCDTREQQNSHILNAFKENGIKYEVCKLPFGDYSFRCEDIDFRLSCVIERKANVNEVWNNITRDRTRFEKEIAAIKAVTGSPILMIENCPDRDFLRSFIVPEHIMAAQGRKVSDIGKYIDGTLQSWSSSNRYNLNVQYLRGHDTSWQLITNTFVCYYRNFSEAIKPLRTS